MANNKPKVLFYDIETSPIIAYVWGLWNNDVGINQIRNDWHVLSWSAKWQGERKVMYQDQRQAKNMEDDRKILRGIWKLLDKADIVVTQNGKKFDNKKLNARFIMHGFQPPSSYRNIDTYVLAKKHFGFTSNKLEYMSNKLCTKYRKQKHAKFGGFELWSECLKGNQAAWREMEKYNRYDVLALEELYNKMVPWDSSHNFSLYSGGLDPVCTCGSTEFVKNGYKFLSTGKYQRYRCVDCGAETRDRENLLSKEKRRSLRRG